MPPSKSAPTAMKTIRLNTEKPQADWDSLVRSPERLKKVNSDQEERL